jgi:succinate dehydrogenase / fumarate reductase cytochrome b subunit
MVSGLTLYQTTVGKKIVMAGTGFILFGYVFVHMYGNLKIYEGPQILNTYGVFLREVGMPFFFRQEALWLVRIVLLAAVVLHIWSAWAVTQADWAARPVGYAYKPGPSARYAAFVMRWGGLLIAVFIIYHLLQFTTGTVDPQFREGDIYWNVVHSFQNPLVSLFYILAMLALGFHLYHGLWSMGQTLGWKHGANNTAWRTFAIVFAVFCAAIGVSIPLAVLVGIVR